MAIGHTGHGRMFSDSDVREDAAAHTSVICSVVLLDIRYLMRRHTTDTRFCYETIFRIRYLTSKCS